MNTKVKQIVGCTLAVAGLGGIVGNFVLGTASEHPEIMVLSCLVFFSSLMFRPTEEYPPLPGFPPKQDSYHGNYTDQYGRSVKMKVNEYPGTGHSPNCVYANFPMPMHEMRSIVYKDYPHAQCIRCGYIITLPEGESQPRQYIPTNIEDKPIYIDTQGVPVSIPLEKRLDDIGTKWSERKEYAALTIHELEEALWKEMTT